MQMNNPNERSISASLLRDQRVEWQPIDRLVPQPRNARTHTRQQIRQIAKSIEEFGFVNPVLTDEINTIIAGHGRVNAARLLGMTEVPTLRLEHLSDVQKRAYALADNRLAELAGWDTNLLAAEFECIYTLDDTFDLTVTGWETPKLDEILGNTGQIADEDDEDDGDQPMAFVPAVSRPGDIWNLGEHRLLCGDARDPSCYERLLDGNRAQMVLTDPPYNVRIDGNVTGLGEVKHREFAMASGEMTEAEFTGFLRNVLRNLVEFSTNGSLHYVFMDWRHAYELLNAARGVYAEQKNLIVWNKSNAGMGSLYRSKHELVFLFKNGNAPHVNNFELGQHGRHRTNVWDYPGANTFRNGRMTDLRAHPTVKNTRLLADAMLDCSERGSIVLDCFAGSGSMLLAAERTQRRAHCMEIDPHYVDVSIKRWQAKSHRAATHQQTGLTFDTISTQQASTDSEGDNIHA